MRVIPSPSLAALTTLRLGGNALAAVVLESRDDYGELSRVLDRAEGEIKILGGGSNVLAADGVLPWTLLLARNEDGPETLAASNGETLLRAGAGLRLPSLLAWCARRGLTGLEGLAGIPGRVGGALAMNAGAYGCEIAPLLRELTIWTPAGGVRTLREGEWEYGYRHFALADGGADGFVVLEAVLALPQSTETAVRQAMRGNMQKKRATQPLTEHTAGCAFKNPPGLSAGKLLDEAGMRGRRKGQVYFSPKHANFLAHDPAGGGSFADALALLDEAREAVARRAGIQLQLEIKVWSCR